MTPLTSLNFCGKNTTKIGSCSGANYAGVRQQEEYFAMVTIRSLTLGDLEQTAALFDQYRQFYRQPSDIAAASEFISERLRNSDSFLIGAFDGRTEIGFTQLYPSFSSVSMRRKLILNDMYVLERFRRNGVAQNLLKAADDLAVELDAAGLVLATQKENRSARKLYETAGWVEESAFVYYNRAPAKVSPNNQVESDA